jgi:hypothetical protein
VLLKELFQVKVKESLVRQVADVEAVAAVLGGLLRLWLVS